MTERLANASLLGLNTFGIPATARELIRWRRVADLKALFPWPGGPEELPLCVGQGSNLLFCHPVVERTVIVSDCDDYEIVARGDGMAVVRAGAGLDWDTFVARTLADGLYGLECLSLIPGTVGASAVQNIGAYGAEAKDCIVTVETLDMLTGEGRIFETAEMAYGYRQSLLKRPEMKRYAVTHVTYRLSTGPFVANLSYKGLRDALGGMAAPTAADVRGAVIALRRSKLPDPSLLGNAGSFFTNPVVEAGVAQRLLQEWPDMPHWAVDGGVKLSAAWLIDKAGWKGRQMGRAAVYDRQPLVLVNLGGATGDDVAALASAVTADVERRFGVTLRPEVNFI